MSDSVLPKFSLDQVKMSDKIVMVGGPSSDKTAMGIRLLTKKMKYGVTEGIVAADTKKKVSRYTRALAEVCPDNQVTIATRIHRPSLLNFVKEAKKEGTSKRFLLVDSVLLKETNLTILNSVFDEGLNLMVVMLVNSVFDVPERFRDKFNYVMVDKYPQGRLNHVASLLKGSSKHMLKIADLVAAHQDKHLVVFDNTKKVEDLEKDKKIMLGQR